MSWAAGRRFLSLNGRTKGSAIISQGVMLQDVGQSILESYSRVLESVASTIIARIDDVLYTDGIVRMSALPTFAPLPKPGTCQPMGTTGSYMVQLRAHGTPHTTTPFVSPSASPTQNLDSALDSLHMMEGTVLIQGPQLTEELVVEFLPTEKQLEEAEVKQLNSNALHSPPSRD
jgi:hypothetical protein